MKKNMFLMGFLTVLLFVVFSCTKIASPTAPDATATPTATAADISTVTLTETEQGTPENTATPTLAFTDTQTHTLTATVTATHSFTDTATETATLTVTETATSTASPTFTATATNTQLHTFISEFGTSGTLDTDFNRVAAICHDENDNLYIADTDASRIKVYNSSGVFQYAFGDFGVLDEQIKYPTGICYDGTNLYVSDAGNFKINVYTKAGVFVRTFGNVDELGDEPLQCRFKNGYIYIASNNKIHKYSAAGVLQASYGTAGTGTGQFNNCRSVFVDNDGNMYCGVVGNSKIVKLDSSGNYVTEWTHYWASDLAQDAGGSLLATASSSDHISVYTMSGTNIYDFGVYGTGEGQLDQPSAISVDSQGYVFIADNIRDKVLKYSK